MESYVPGPTVLLTQGWCRSSYSALRGLAKHDVRVVVTDSAGIGMSQASRLAYARDRYASPHEDPERFMADVVRLCERHRIGLLLPGHDEGELLVAAREAGQLPSGVTLPLVDSATLALVNDKDRMSRLARERGIPVAPILDYRTPALAAHATVPAVEYVLRARRGNSSKGVRFSPGGKALGAAISAMMDDFGLDATRPPIVQQRVPGDGWGVSCLYWRGERIASFTHRRLQEKVATGGTSTLRISDTHRAMEADAHRLLDGLGWHGLAMLEFKHDPETGQHVFIEINPRLWGSIDLALSAGVNFPWLLYLAHTRGVAVSRAHFHPARQGVVARWLLGDVLRRLDLLRRGRLAAALAMVGGPRAHSFDDAKWDDPLILLGESLYYLAKGIRRHSLNPVEAGMVR